MAKKKITKEQEQQLRKEFKLEEPAEIGYCSSCDEEFLVENGHDCEEKEEKE